MMCNNISIKTIKELLHQNYNWWNIRTKAIHPFSGMNADNIIKETGFTYLPELNKYMITLDSQEYIFQHRTRQDLNTFHQERQRYFDYEITKDMLIPDIAVQRPYIEALVPIYTVDHLLNKSPFSVIVLPDINNQAVLNTNAAKILDKTSETCRINLTWSYNYNQKLDVSTNVNIDFLLNELLDIRKRLGEDYTNPYYFKLCYIIGDKYTSDDDFIGDVIESMKDNEFLSLSR